MHIAVELEALNIRLVVLHVVLSTKDVTIRIYIAVNYREGRLTQVQDYSLFDFIVFGYYYSIMR